MIPSPSPLDPVEPRAYSASRVLARALLATALIVGIAGAYAWLNTSGNPGLPAVAGDNPSRQQQQPDDLGANTLLQLSVVAAADIPAALDSMQLDPAARQTLVAAMGSPNAAPQAAPTAHAAHIAPIRLCWITAWDTDNEDGDAVRLESRGYSRTVVLKKQPVTFAMPIPANGVIDVVGLQDGEGGGITVGLASGSAQAVFPIMSTGQRLGLRTRTP